MPTINQEQLLAAQQEIISKMETLRSELKTTGEKLFKEGSQELFDLFPQLEAFSWTQYTPYFMDGDPCEFSANTNYLNVKLNEGGPIPEDEDEAQEWEYDGNIPWELTAKPDGPYFREPTDDSEVAMLAVYRLTNSIDEDTLRDLFGDHVRVVVSREGIDVEDYDHE